MSKRGHGKTDDDDSAKKLKAADGQPAAAAAAAGAGAGAHAAAAEEKIEFEEEAKGESVRLRRNTNQALGIAHFCHEFLFGKKWKGPDASVFKRVEQFHTDSVVCGLSALALKTNSPTVLRTEALDYTVPAGSKLNGAYVFGSDVKVAAEKAVVANVAAVREWDSNGTVFGYNEKLNHKAGEFGHNDFYPAVIAACQIRGYDGAMAARAMILVDEIRGRLAEVFSLKTYKIDHVVHGGIASAAVYGALMGATPKQIEYAIGMVVAHYIPFRAIRAGHQLSDSKGASAAITTEVALLCVHRAMRGFIGPQDVFRNPEAIFRYFTKQTKGGDHGDSPFDIVLSHSGADFAVMGMHFKLGLYEHQSAGALQGLVNALLKHPEVLTKPLKSIKIVAYEPAFGIIGDPAKRDPHTRQSADHSMVYILCSKLKKAIALAQAGALAKDNDGLWKQLMLFPIDYSHAAIFDAQTRLLMTLCSFAHGGKQYDDNYPDGIPTSIVITAADGQEIDSGMIMYPTGHARNTTANLQAVLTHKWANLGALAVGAPKVDALLTQLNGLQTKTAAQIQAIYRADITYTAKSIDD